MSNEIMGYVNPFRAIDEFEKRLFNTPFASYDNKGDGLFRTDIKEDADGNKYVLAADLPGFKKEDIKLDVDGEVLTISAERHNEEKETDEKGRFVRRERSYGKYSRQFDISAIDPTKIAASYEDGVLKLDMPKKEELVPKKHQIAIQ